MQLGQSDTLLIVPMQLPNLYTPPLFHSYTNNCVYWIMWDEQVSLLKANSSAQWVEGARIRAESLWPCSPAVRVMVGYQKSTDVSAIVVSMALSHAYGK